jgi:hypothetical protein
LLVAGWLRPTRRRDAALLEQRREHLEQVQVDRAYIHALDV